MSGGDSFLTYRQLVGELRRLCAERKTGSVFVTTSENHSVRFALQNGTIIAVYFRNQIGPDALASIQKIRKGRLSFSDGLRPSEPQDGLPSTHELLTLLQSAESDHTDVDEAKPALSSEALVRSRAVIEAELVEYLGPMGRVVFDEHMATASTVAALIESLAREFSDPTKAAQFKERIRERIPRS